MSVETAIAFLEKLKSDTTLQQKLVNITKENPSSALEAGLKIAAEVGFRFSADDWKAALSQHSSELSEADLEQVAGGIQSDPNFNSYLLKKFGPCMGTK